MLTYTYNAHIHAQRSFKQSSHTRTMLTYTHNAHIHAQRSFKQSSHTRTMLIYTHNGRSSPSTTCKASSLPVLLRQNLHRPQTLLKRDGLPAAVCQTLLNRDRRPVLVLYEWPKAKNAWQIHRTITHDSREWYKGRETLEKGGKFQSRAGNGIMAGVTKGR